MEGDLVARLTAALAGRYGIQRQLGEGGMATVYLARDLRHGRDVALKVLKPDFTAAVGAGRFLAEIRTTASLQHPHILPLFDSGEADGSLFYVMPYVAGETLAQRLARERQLPIADAVQIATNVAEALDYAHRQGVVHRDIKPANILLHDGKPVVSDFGIALAVSAGVSRLTQTGFSLGTPHYMSPEQATGDVAVGAATDVWALGCVLYEMLVGEPPYTGSTPQAILGKIIQGQPTWATQARRTVPLNVDAAIRTALEKIPADRFTTAGGFAVALRDPGFRHRQSIVGGRAGARRSPWQAALLVGLGVTVGLFAPVAWLLARPGASTPAEVMRFALPTSGSAALETGTVAQDLTISPDGKLIAYTGATVDGSDLQIHVWSVGQLSGERLRGAEGGFSPFFSPDGQWIGFVDTADGTTLKRVPTTGGRTETIATLPDSVSYVAGAAWGADDIIVGTGQAGGLYRVSLDGVAPVRLTKGQHHWPALVEGRDAVLLMDHANGQHLAALDLRTGEVKPLGVEGTSPRYVSTGHLVYASPDGALWGVPFDPASLEVRGSPVLLAEGVDVKAATESAANFAVSATGHLIYAAGRTATNLVMVARDGARSVLLEQNGWSAYPRFSPDGSRLVYDLSSGDGTGAVDLWVLDVARGARTRVTLDGDNRFYPVWTPDGVRLTHATTSGPRAAIVSTSADGSGAADTLLPSGRGGYPTSWAPNGRTLAYDVPSERTATGSGDIALLHVDGGGNRTEPFLETAFHEAGAIFSPNGRWIVYVSDKSGQADIYVRPFPGPGGEVTISVGGGEEPRWSRAGDEIYFRRGADLLAVSVGERGSALEVGTPRHVMTDPYRREGGAMANYDVQPGGEGVVVVENANSSDAPTDRLYLVLNWFTELRVRSPR